MYKLLNKNACHDVSLLTVVILHLLCTTSPLYLQATSSEELRDTGGLDMVGN